MRIEDITYLKENVRNLPVWEKKGENELKPLSNLFVVASQAHTVGNGNTDELLNILKRIRKFVRRSYLNIGIVEKKLLDMALVQITFCQSVSLLIPLIFHYCAKF